MTPVRMIQKAMDMGGISVHVDTGCLEIYADPLVKKVFSNLINHSLRHGGPVSEIRITAREIGNRLTILYEDNGTGIADEQKETIFEREYGKNTGLGLFLAREILAITGITITETGKVGRGVRFEITMPERAYRLAET